MPKLTAVWKVNLQIKKVQDKVEKANRLGLRDTVVDIMQTLLPESPIDTGHNRRSMAFKVENKATRKGRERTGENPFETGEPNLKKLEAAVYSTSGYGGYLETGTAIMPARPYMKPAFDRHAKDLPKNIKRHMP